MPRQMNHSMDEAKQSSQRSQKSASRVRHIEREDLGRAQVRARRAARRRSIVQGRSNTMMKPTRGASPTDRR
jgi:hypothetical protein